jgi:hypothetical protein
MWAVKGQLPVNDSIFPLKAESWLKSFGCDM